MHYEEIILDQNSLRGSLTTGVGLHTYILVRDKKNPHQMHHTMQYWTGEAKGTRPEVIAKAVIKRLGLGSPLNT